MKLLQVFIAGTLISFLGSLPPGMLNVAALQLSMSQGYIAASWFVLGCTLVEMIYVRLSLVAMHRIMKHAAVIRALQWLTLALLLFLAARAVMAACSPHEEVHQAVLPAGMHPFVAGILLMAVNPMSLPFWFGWNTILYSRNILVPEARYYNIYPFGVGLGSLLGGAVFIGGGQLLARLTGGHEAVIDWSFAGLFLVFAVLQLWKNLKQVRMKTLEHS